jgi:hypothetical protein
MEVLNVCVNLNALGNQNKYVWTIFQTIEMDGIQISLLNVACLNFIQNVIKWKSFKVYHIG